ncbi:hypothetical protein BC831DRAFT_483303 [Entophlyctis helioformis]|nr:hypothetical protein BC831DRAFT_483303 [Entophlyctis helioformis]
MSTPAPFVLHTTELTQPALVSALAHLKTLLAQPWTPLFESKGVTATTTKPLPGFESPVPVTRGEVLAPEGLSVYDVLNVFSVASLRPAGDDRTEMAETKTFNADGTTFVYSVQKGVWPVSPRDFIVANSTVMYDAELAAHVILQASVERADVPVASGKVRGVLHLAALLVNETADGRVRVVYVADADSKGTVPAAIVKIVATATPMCAGRMVEHAVTKGVAPKVYSGRGYTVSAYAFDAKTARAAATIAVDAGMDTVVVVDSRVYPTGVCIEVTGGVTAQTVEGGKDGRVLVSLKADKGAGEVGVTFSKLAGGAAGDVKVVSN